jgi:hypothetical protein
MDIDTDVITPVLTVVPARDVLSVDGTGAAEEPAFGAAIRALFAVRRLLGARDDVPLEGSYAQHGDPLRFELDSPAGWHWRLLVPAPPGADAASVAAAAARFAAPVHLRRVGAQLVAQLLHRGRYADEAPSIATLERFVSAQGREPIGPHTEVYLTDPADTPEDRMRTLLRQPVRW